MKTQKAHKQNPTPKSQKGKLTEAERVFTEELLELLHKEGFELTKGTALTCLVGARMVRESLQREEQNERTKQEERQHRDSLQGQAKVDYIVEELKKFLSHIRAPYQDKKLLPLALKEQRLPENWQHSNDGITYYKGRIEEILGGLSEAFRQKVVAKYRAEVLPERLAKDNKEQDEQNATDEFLALANNKTPEEIRAMTKLLRKVA